MKSVLRNLGVFFLLSGIGVHAQDDAKPRLVIDPQGHSALVKRLIFTPDGDELISLGFDKTIRVWDVKTGKQKDTLRMEIGAADAGKHYAGALSPNGRYLAVGGWATEDTELVGRIRVVDMGTGKMAAVLRGHKNVVNDLAFSPDGTVLLSASADEAVRVWKVADFSENNGEGAADITNSTVLQGNSGGVLALAVGKGGDVLVTGGIDQKVLVWRKEGSSYSRVATLSGHSSTVGTLACTSDGSRAVSGDFEGNLYFWDLESGARIEGLDKNLDRQIGTMAISPDDKKLLVSSTGAKVGKTVIIDLSSGKEEVVFEKHTNSVFASAWHPGGDLVATSGGDNYETYLWRPKTVSGEPPGTVLHEIKGDGAPAYNVGYSTVDPFKVTIGVQPPENGWLPMAPLNFVYDFQSFTLKPLTSAEEAAKFITLNWQNGDQQLSVEDGVINIAGRGKITNPHNRNDPFRTGTFSADGSSVVAGSAFYLIRFQDSGGNFKEVINYIGHEADINAVSVSPDGKCLISGSMDQSARLWNFRTGELLASLFVAQDGEWVCWTPEGYFTASSDGGKYIGWHFNKGLDKMAEFISGEQLYDHFFRPDIVEKVIAETKTSAEVARGLNLAFDLKEALSNKPGVEILEPGDNTTATERRVTIRAAAIDNGGGIGELRVFHEGKRLQPDGPGSFRDGRYEAPFTISLLSGENEIRAVAVSAKGVESAPKTVTVTFGGTKASAKLYVLAVGVNKYKNPRFELSYCRPDVESFADAFEKRSKKLYTEIEVIKLFDEDATGEKISASMREIAGKANADDVFVFAFAGHGAMSEPEGEKESQFYIIPYDVTQMYGNSEVLDEKAISGTRLQELAASIPARKQLMVLDACQSGGVVGSFAVRGAAEEKALAQLARSAGMYVLASTRSEQYAMETEKLGHGIFTYALLEGMDGKGDMNKDGKITIKEVEAYLNERVPELGEEYAGGAQYPNSFARGQDFPIGIVD